MSRRRLAALNLASSLVGAPRAEAQHVPERADSAYVTVVRGELARLADGATGK